MKDGLKALLHETAALREEDAAAFATSPMTAQIHATLADLHRREFARLSSVRRALDVAFGDETAAPGAPLSR